MSNDIHPQEGADAHAAARKNNKDRLLLVSKLLWDIVLPSTGITAATRPLSPSQTTTESSPATTTPDAVADETDRLLRRASYAAAIDYECEAVLWSSNNSDQPQPCRRDSAHDSLAWAAVGREPHLRPGALAAARESAATVLRLGEALFPLTPAACRHVARECAGSRTGALWAAARNGAVRCVAWMVSHHTTMMTMGDSLRNHVPPSLLVDSGGGGDGGETVRRGNGSRAGVKELVVVLAGLCVGGHREVAKRLVEGGLEEETRGCLWWPRRAGEGQPESLPLPLEVASMDYLVRDTRVVEFVCENGDLETAKWLVEKFRIPAWELHKAWTGACHSGNIQLFSWLYEVFCSLHDPFFDVHPAVAGLHAGKVDFFKWALENYPADVRGVAKDVYKELTPEVATVEFLEWLFNCKKFPLPKQDQVMDLVSLYCYSLETVKWFIDEVPKFVHGAALLTAVCKAGNLPVVKWLLNERNIAPTPAIFGAACLNGVTTGCQTPPLDTAKLVLEAWPEQPPSGKDLTKLFEAAMNWGSAPAILWLAELYPEVADEIIRKRGYTIMNVLCSHSGKYDSGQIAWGLQHTALNAKQVPACLKSLLLHQCYDNGFLLLDRYPDLAQKAQLITFLGSLIKYGSLRQIKKLLSMCHVLSKSDVSECLTAFPSVDRCVLPTASSKAVKWLVCKANMTAEEVKRNSNALLFRLYYNNKIHCAEWLISKFSLGSPDVIEMSSHHQAQFCLPGAAFQSLCAVIRPFPTVDMTHEHFLQMVLSNPVAVELAVSRGMMTKPEAQRFLEMLPTVLLPYPHKPWAKEYLCLTP